MSKQVILGFHAVSARMRFAANSIVEIYTDAARNDKRLLSFIQQAKALGIKVYPVETFRLNGLAKGGRHQGVVAIAEAVQQQHHLEDVLEVLTEPALLLVLDQITDPHNLGACLRSANAAGVHAVIAPKDHAAHINSTVERVACGASSYTPYITVTNLARTLRDLKDKGIWIVGTDDQAQQSLYQVDAKLPTAWVLGAEGEGLRRLTKETCDTLVHIPMLGSVESLNVSVASAVCLYETVRQRTV